MIIDEDRILGLMIMQPRYKEGLDIDVNFFKEAKQREIFKEIQSYNGNIKTEILKSHITERFGDECVSSLTDGLWKLAAKDLPLYINKIRANRLKEQATSLIERGAELGKFDHDTIHKLYLESHRLEKDIKGKELSPIITRLVDVEAKPVEWLWFNRFPLGKLSLIVGDPGLGKSFVSIYMASRVTTGEPWPEIGAPTLKGSVIILTAEDGIADTVRIRADAAGADVSKIFIIEGVKRPGKEDGEFFNIREHLPALENAVEELGDVKLVCIDPLTAYMGDIEGHSTTQTRSTLAPVSMIAEKHNVAIIGITHLNKNTAARAIYRTMGSLAFTAAARAVWVVTKDEDDDSGQRRFFTPLKTNLSVNPTSLAFKIQDGAVVFEPNPVDVSTDDVLSSENASEKGAVADAKMWLTEALADGPVSSGDIFKMAKENGISEASLRRAKEKLSVYSYKDGYGAEGKWLWRLRDNEID